MSDVMGRVLVAWIGLAAVLCMVPVIVVILAEALRNIGSGDPYQPYRWSTVSMFGLGTLFVVWREVIWLDVALFAGRLLGPTAMRWPLDLVVGLVALMLAAYPSYVFWRARAHGQWLDVAALMAVASQRRRAV
jgi:hypothetical protein